MPPRIEDVNRKRANLLISKEKAVLCAFEDLLRAALGESFDMLIQREKQMLKGVLKNAYAKQCELSLSSNKVVVELKSNRVDPEWKRTYICQGVLECAVAVRAQAFELIFSVGRMWGCESSCEYTTQPIQDHSPSEVYRLTAPQEHRICFSTNKNWPMKLWIRHKQARN